jgi:hypothetical protein
VIDATAVGAPGSQDGRSYLLVGLDDSTSELANWIGWSAAAAGEHCLVIDASGTRMAGEDHGLAAWLLSDSADPPPQLPGGGMTTVGLAGPSGGQDLMRTERWRSALGQLGATHPVVLIAVRPIAGSADALALARVVTGTVLVVSTGKSDGSQLLQARAAIESAGGTVLGIVLA